MTPSILRLARLTLAAALLAASAPVTHAAIAAVPAAATPAAVAVADASGTMPDGLTSPIADDAAHALWLGDFDRLEALYRSVRASTELVDGGISRLQWMRVGLARVFNEDNATDPYFAQLEALTHQWSVEHPQSPLAQLLYAQGLRARAWSFRGDGYASTVTPAAMKEFRRYIALEREHLEKNAALLKGESTADLYLISIGRIEGMSLPDQRALALDALARNPADAQAFVELATGSLPKWGGSPEQFDAVAREAARRLRPGTGMAMYAALYDDNLSDFNGELFEASEADWPLMRQGFRDWMAHWPSRYMLNRFARVACHAQDRETTRAVLDQIGDKPMDRAWGNQFETCRRWARSP